LRERKNEKKEKERERDEIKNKIIYRFIGLKIDILFQ